jgi:hypothetical protein
MRNLTRFGMLGGALSFMTACALGGHVGDASRAINKTSGIKRYAMGSDIGFIFSSGSGLVVHSMDVAAIKFNGDKVKTVNSYLDVEPYPAPVGGFDPCLQILGCVANLPSQRVAWSTADTSGDGWISGGLGGSGGCGITSGIGFLGANAPASAYFQDQTACSNPETIFSTTRTEHQTSGGGIQAVDQNPGGLQSRFRQMPMSVMQDIINSIDSSDIRTEVRNGVRHEIVRATITNVRIGGASYRPVGVSIEIEDMNPQIAVRNDNPGVKLLAAWMANEMEQALNRGATKLRGSVTINGSATVSTDSIPSNVLYTGVSQAQVDRLREFATTNVRGE